MKGLLAGLCDGPLAEATDLEQTRKMVLDIIEPSNLPPKEKRKMIYEVTTAPTLEKLQRYCYNAMLHFNGLGAGNRFR